MSLFDDLYGAAKKAIGVAPDNTPLRLPEPIQMSPDAGDRLRNAAYENPSKALADAQYSRAGAAQAQQAIPPYEQRLLDTEAGTRLRNAPAPDPAQGLGAQIAQRQQARLDSGNLLRNAAQADPGEGLGAIMAERQQAAQQASQQSANALRTGVRDVGDSAARLAGAGQGGPSPGQLRTQLGMPGAASAVEQRLASLAPAPTGAPATLEQALGAGALRYGDGSAPPVNELARRMSIAAAAGSPADPVTVPRNPTPSAPMSTPVAGNPQIRPDLSQPIAVNSAGQARLGLTESPEAQALRESGALNKIPNQVGNPQARPTVPGMPPAAPPAPADPGMIGKLRASLGLGEAPGAAGAAAPGTATGQPTPAPTNVGGNVGAGAAPEAAASPIAQAAKGARASVGRQVVNGLGLAGKVLKPAAALGGALETYQAAQRGDTPGTVLGGLDTAAGVGLFTPAAPAAGLYLTGRGMGQLAGPSSIAAAAALEGGNWMDPSVAQANDDNAARFAKKGAPAATSGAEDGSANAAESAKFARQGTPAGTPVAYQDEADDADRAGLATDARNKQNAAIRADGSAINTIARQALLNELPPQGAITSGKEYPDGWHYTTADGRALVKPAALAPQDKELLNRVSIIDGQGGAGTLFEQDGRQYRNVQLGLDPTGAPLIKAMSIDGQGNFDQAHAQNVARDVNEAQAKLGTLSPADEAAIAEYHDRETRRAGIERDYPDTPLAPAEIEKSGEPMLRSAATKGAGLIASPYAQKTGHVPFGNVADPATRRNFQIFGAALGGGAEGADYDTIVGGKHTISDFSRHPNLVGLKTADGDSTAAGRYQITGSTFKDVAKKMNLTDFSPESQDRAFLGLLERRGALEDVAAGRFDQAVSKLGQEWQGLPSGASKNQGKRSPAQWQAALDTARQLYGGDGQLQAGGSAEVNSQAAAQLGGPGQQIAQAARGAAPDWANPDNTVQIYQDGHNTVAVPGSGAAMSRIDAQAYDAYRDAAQRDPALGRRMQLGDQGAVVDGALVPASVLGGGAAAVNDYLANVRAGAQYSANPVAGKIAEEVGREVAHRTPVPGEVVNVPQEVGRDQVGNPVIKNEPYIRQRDGSVKPAVPQVTYPEPNSAQLDALKKNPNMAPDFDRKFGPGAARRVLSQGKP